MVDQYYSTIEIADIHFPLKVTKLSIFSENSMRIDAKREFDDFVDEKVAADYEFAIVLVDCFIPGHFHIKPAHVLATNDFSMGMTIDWIPSKPIFVTSKIDYIALYESFVEYLETAHQICENHYEGKPVEKEFLICFSSLYENTDVFVLGTEGEHTINPLFDGDNFDSDITTVTTLNATFEL
jgi:hypothetical protein